MSTTSTLNKKFNYLMIYDFLSSFGSIFTSLALSMIFFIETESLLQVGIIMGTGFLPKIILSKKLKSIYYRINYKYIFLILDTMSACSVLFFIRADNFYLILINYTFFSTLGFLAEVYRMEFFKEIVPKEEVHVKQSVSQIINITVRVITPILASFIIYRFGKNIAYIIDTVSFLVAGIFMLLTFENYTYINSPQQAFKSWKNYGIHFKKTLNTEIYLGMFLLVVLGGIGSFLTLEYIYKYLNTEIYKYGLLIAITSVFSIAGNMAINIPSVKKNIETFKNIAFLGIGMLMMTVLFKPKFLILILIMSISSMLSAIIGAYYSIRLFELSHENDDIIDFGIFQLLLDSGEMVSRPLAGLLNNLISVIYSIFFSGILFVVLFIFSIVGKNIKGIKKSKSEAQI